MLLTSLHRHAHIQLLQPTRYYSLCRHFVHIKYASLSIKYIPDIIYISLCKMQQIYYIHNVVQFATDLLYTQRIKQRCAYATNILYTQRCVVCNRLAASQLVTWPTRHTVNSSKSQLVTVNSSPDQLVTQSTRHIVLVNSSHGIQLVAVKSAHNQLITGNLHTRTKWLDTYFLVTYWLITDRRSRFFIVNWLCCTKRPRYVIACGYKLHVFCMLYVFPFLFITYIYANKDMCISYVRRGVFIGALQSEKLTSNAMQTRIAEQRSHTKETRVYSSNSTLRPLAKCRHTCRHIPHTFGDVPIYLQLAFNVY